MDLNVLTLDLETRTFIKGGPNLRRDWDRLLVKTIINIGAPEELFFEGRLRSAVPFELVAGVRGFVLFEELSFDNQRQVWALFPNMMSRC